MTLWSGPPQRYKGKRYGPRNVRIDNDFGVVMDTEKGELSFVLNGVCFGIAYDGIPLDKPLVPAVVFGDKSYKIKLYPAPVDVSEEDYEIGTPRNVRVKSTTWDAITVTWDFVDFAMYYQVEHEAGKWFGATSKTVYSVEGLEPGTGYTIRVRAVKGKFVGPWSDPVREYTQKPYFERSMWRECPESVEERRQYSLDEGSDGACVAHKIGRGSIPCVVVATTPIPAKKRTAWFVRVLKTTAGGCKGIYVGLAPSSVDQACDEPLKCGWFLGCHDCALFSGSPHDYTKKEYGPRKNKDGKYLKEGEGVGVVVDTTSGSRGDVSFVLGFEDLGPAYKGVPLDKPLVPCVIFTENGDSVEIITREERMPKKGEGKKAGKDNDDCLIS